MQQLAFLDSGFHLVCPRCTYVEIIFCEIVVDVVHTEFRSPRIPTIALLAQLSFPDR